MVSSYQAYADAMRNRQSRTSPFTKSASTSSTAGPWRSGYGQGAGVLKTGESNTAGTFTQNAGTSGTSSPQTDTGTDYSMNYAPAPVSAPPAAAAPVTPPPAPTPPPPPPINDVDWFNADGVYKAQAGNSLADLTSQLAQIMADRDGQYGQLKNTRTGLGEARTEDLRGAAGDAGNRGMLGSGLFAQQADRVDTEYAKQNGQLDQVGQELLQQYGQSGQKVDLSQLAAGANNGMGNLNSIYGLLGALGVGAGNDYQSAVSGAKAASAGRATQPLVQTVKWG